MQDCLENVFSIIRSKNVIPNAVQFKNNLKLITISQYIKHIKHSSYENDDREFFSEFLDLMLDKNRARLLRDKDESVDNEIVQINETICDNIVLNNMALNSLYYLGGYILYIIKTKEKICDICISATGSTDFIVLPYSELTIARCLKEETLFFMNEPTFYFIL